MFLRCVTDSGTTHVCLHQGWTAMGTNLPVFVPLKNYHLSSEHHALVISRCSPTGIIVSSVLLSFKNSLTEMATQRIAANSHSFSPSFRYAAVPSITQPPSKRNLLRRLSPATEADDISDQLLDTCGYVSGHPSTLMTSQCQ